MMMMMMMMMQMIHDDDDNASINDNQLLTSNKYPSRQQIKYHPTPFTLFV